jgi:hypothetical protein
MPDGNRKGLRHGPAAFNAIRKRVSTNSGSIRPFGHRQSLALESQKMVTASVSRLGSLIGPTAMSGFVVPIQGTRNKRWLISF